MHGRLEQLFVSSTHWALQCQPGMASHMNDCHPRNYTGEFCRTRAELAAGEGTCSVEGAKLVFISLPSSQPACLHSGPEMSMDHLKAALASFAWVQEDSLLLVGGKLNPNEFSEQHSCKGVANF